MLTNDAVILAVGRGVGGGESGERWRDMFPLDRIRRTGLPQAKSIVRRHRAAKFQVSGTESWSCSCSSSIAVVGAVIRYTVLHGITLWLADDRALD